MLEVAQVVVANPSLKSAKRARSGTNFTCTWPFVRLRDLKGSNPTLQLCFSLADDAAAEGTPTAHSATNDHKYRDEWSQSGGKIKRKEGRKGTFFLTAKETNPPPRETGRGRQFRRGGVKQDEG